MRVSVAGSRHSAGTRYAVLAFLRHVPGIRCAYVWLMKSMTHTHTPAELEDDMITTETSTQTPQQAAATRILTALQADGRFAARCWTAGDKCRVYVESYGYIAIGQDGTVYPSLSRYRGNISRAAGL